MFDSMGKPFFAALARAAKHQLGAEDPCVVALDRAAASVDPATIGAAQELLAGLPETQRDGILAAAHAALRVDPTMLMRTGTLPVDRSRMH